MATVRERVEAEVTAALNTHCPRLWRARAALYVPLVVDRLVLIIETVKGEVDHVQ